MADVKYAFLPTNNNSPPFQATIYMDGSGYILKVWFNIYSQRWYFSLYDFNQTIIKTAPLISSTATHDINLTFNLFTRNSLVFREDIGFILVRDIVDLLQF
ncbi:phage baseplate plug family protein [Commensalibacter nepenthis]|uniref:Cyanophage baseplate Pam3 plug gp18 domain-containing protein n=1 Tax=Commensalibacter nepenthis TaxID=3043872 RepID=A0ABT6Q8J9_9PROT|nr:hypothetical protein [Commensalibacter sp. TBRC 10068]MDI2113077.1 hypothetical protein [Commensalibacter sp. TBRC 10068]